MDEWWIGVSGMEDGGGWVTRREGGREGVMRVNGEGTGCRGAQVGYCECRVVAGPSCHMQSSVMVTVMRRDVLWCAKMSIVLS